MKLIKVKDLISVLKQEDNQDMLLGENNMKDILEEYGEHGI